MAKVVRIAPSVPAAYAEAVERYIAATGVAESSRRIYRISLTTWAWLLAGEQPPPRRRGAAPPEVSLAQFDDPGLPPGWRRPSRHGSPTPTPSTGSCPCSVPRSSGGRPRAGSPATPAAAWPGCRRRPTGPGR